MTLDDLLGPNWRNQVAGYSYHGNVGLDNGGAVPFTTTGGQSGYLKNQTSKADGGPGGLVFFTDNGTNNFNFDDSGNATGSYQGNEAGITGGDLLRGIGTIGAGMGLGALATAGMAGGGAAMDAAAASDAGGGSLGGAATGFDPAMEAAAASDAGGGSLGGAATADGGLGGGMGAEDFSFGADAPGAAGADGGLSALGSALAGGGTGFASILPLLSGLVGAKDAKNSASTANDLANRLIAASDPFAKYRAGYGQKLQDLETSHDVTSIPGYQAGLEAVQRSGAAEGFTGSGNMMKSLQDYGGNFYNAELQRLAGLAGAGATPGAGFATGAGLIGAGQKQGAFGDQQTIQALGSGFNLLQSLGQGGGSFGQSGFTPSVGNPMPETGEMV